MNSLRLWLHHPAAGTSRPDGHNRFIHDLLMSGLVLSSLLLAVGFVLALSRDGALPGALPPLAQVFPLALAFQPAGLIAAGLLALIATPILCVFGLMIIFLVEHDWRYAAITGVVFLIVLSSILSGRK